ncbi:hypothetical protein D7V97_30020 [Corallococcus sp. CA053C]|uniref:hypothetical protein n=1 Tax=Corallococcus sp. CA053C TaxID=2316732 RepID=UPI000EA13C66|nr:hypothetical protein [Corallococcus sp. CA053C]RKH00643.1 hypothetical protein D7V97_30020 [Corallococcus sp. CA053C]
MSEERRRRLVAVCASAVLMLWAGALLLSQGARGDTNGKMKPQGVSTHRASRAPPPATEGLEPVPLEQLTVTQGDAQEVLGSVPDGLRFGIEGPRLRAVAPETTGDDVGLRFTWLGATDPVLPLASGKLREQVGLKLRAKDGCNVIYAMWRIAPSAGIVVNFKRNPDDHRSGECGGHGYTTVRPRFMEPLDPLVPGQAHVLRARIAADVLTVFVDGKRVWEGLLPADALTLEGPVGMRTDNARVRFQLLVPQAGGPTSRR